MSAIGPGDWVEYVGSPKGRVAFPHVNCPLRRGNIYQVTEVGRRCRDAAGTIWPSIRVAGGQTHNEQGHAVSYPAVSFRPVYRPSADLIQSLLKPIPAEPESVNA